MTISDSAFTSCDDTCVHAELASNVSLEITGSSFYTNTYDANLHVDMTETSYAKLHISSCSFHTVSSNNLLYLRITGTAANNVSIQFVITPQP